MWLVFFRQRELEVDSGQESENVGLKNSDQDFKERESDSESQCSGSANVPVPLPNAKNEEVSGREQKDEEEVPDNHVHEKSERERDGTQDKGREQFDWRDDDVERLRYTRRKERVLEERDGVLFQPGVNKRDVRHDRENKRNSNDGGPGDVKAGDDSRDVEEKDEKEDSVQTPSQEPARHSVASVPGSPASEKRMSTSRSNPLEIRFMKLSKYKSFSFTDVFK